MELRNREFQEVGLIHRVGQSSGGALRMRDREYAASSESFINASNKSVRKINFYSNVIALLFQDSVYLTDFDGYTGIFELLEGNHQDLVKLDKTSVINVIDKVID